MISTKQKQEVDFALYHKKQLIRFCKKFHKDCYRLIGQKMALKDKVEELEQQIEKMKCCYNCANDTLEPPEVIGNGICEYCKNHDKWEMNY